jgi:hypothetical protein
VADTAKVTDILKLTLLAVLVFFSIAAFYLYAFGPRQSTTPPKTGANAEGAVRQRIKITQKQPEIDPAEFARRQAEQQMKEWEEFEKEDLAQRNEIWAKVKKELEAKFAPSGEFPQMIELATPRYITQFAPPKPVAGAPPPPVTPLPPPVRVFVKDKRIEFEAKTCLVGGSWPPEVLLCDPGGRVHESILVTEVNPYDVWQGLLLLGLEMCYGPRSDSDDRPLDGDRVLIFVEWKDKENKPVRVYTEDLIYNMDTNKSMERTGWLFTGSHFVTNPQTNATELIAARRGNIAVTWHRPEAILDNPSPDGANPNLYKVYEGHIPERGTPVTVIITPHEKYNAARREKK